MADREILQFAIEGAYNAKEAFTAFRDDLGSVDDGVGKTNSKLSLLGPAALGAGGLLAGALIGVGVAAVDMSGQINDMTNNLQVQLGLGRMEAEELGDVAVNVFRHNFGDSLAEAGEAVGLVTQQLADLAGAGSIEQMTEQAFRLRDSFGVEVSESVSTVNTLMKDFGLTSDQAFDFITAGMQKGLNRSGDFLESITEYSTQFKAGGASADQFFSVLQSGLQGGVLGTDKAADAFKEFRVRILDGSELTAASLAQIGINAEEMTAALANGSLTSADAFQTVLDKLREAPDEATRFQAGVGLLGTQFEDLGTQGVAALTTLGTGLADAAGATEKLDAKYQSLGQVLEGFKRQALLAIVPVGDAILKIANDGVPPVIDGIEAISAVLKRLFEDNDVAEQIRELLGPIATELGATLESVIAFGQAVVSTIQEHWDQIAPIVEPILEHIKTTVGNVLELIALNIQFVLNLIQGDWSEAWQNVKAMVAVAWDQIKAVVQLALDEIPAILHALMALHEVIIREGWELAVLAAKAGGRALVDGVREVPGLIEDALSALPGMMGRLGEAAMMALLRGIQAAWPAVKRAIEGLLDDLPGPIKSALGLFVGEGGDTAAPRQWDDVPADETPTAAAAGLRPGITQKELENEDPGSRRTFAQDPAFSSLISPMRHRVPLIAGTGGVTAGVTGAGFGEVGAEHWPRAGGRGAGATMQPIQLVLDGRVVGEILAPILDSIAGTRQQLALANGGVA